MTQPIETIRTAVPGLDEVLGGGLWEGSVYLLEGLPGTGKTILANQIAFDKARSGGKVFYVSLVSESHAKLLHNIRGMTFFDETLVGSGVYYVSGYRSLVDEGLPGLFDFIAAQTRDQGLSLLVVEGFSSAEYLKRDIFDFAQFLHRLNALATTLRCTMLLVCHDQGTDEHPEHTLVDGVIEVSRVSRGMRTMRFVQVHKIRGMDPILGRHALTISGEGIVVYPRLEAVATRHAARDAAAPGAAGGRARFGVAGLDAMLHDGLVRGGVTAILGAPGSGKTLLSLKFLGEGLRGGERALYFGFYEPPERLLEKGTTVGVDLRAPARDGRLRLVWRPPLEYSPDELAWTLLGAVSEHRPQRVVVDGIDGFLAAAFERTDLSMFFTALASRLRALGVDALFTEELPLGEYGAHDQPRLIPVVENVLLLRHVEFRGGRRRFLTALKVRESDYDASLKEVRISPSGIDLSEPPPEAVGVFDARIGR